jgi:hypothetical protein
MGVRDFANTFLVPLLVGITKIGQANDKGQEMMESGGKQIPIIPAQWTDNYDMEVDVALTPEEANVMAGRLLSMDARLSQDEEMKPLYGMKQKHTLYDTVFELMGIKDSMPFMASPEDPQTQQAIQQSNAQAQAAAKEAQEKVDQLTQFQMWATKDDLEIRWATLNNTVMDDLHDNALDDDKHQSDVHFKEEELEIERTQERGVSI